MKNILAAVRFWSLMVFAVVWAFRASAQPGVLDTTFNVAFTNPVVAHLLVQPDGHVVVRYGWPAYTIVRLNLDGSLDFNFNPGLPPGAGVNSIGAQPDGKVVIAGNFLTVQGVARPCLARLNMDGTLDDGFVPQIMAGNIPTQPTNYPPLPYNPTNGVGTILVQPDGKVLVTGMSYMVATNGSKLPVLIRLNADGSLDSSFAVFTNSPYRMAVQSDGKILIEEAISWNYPGSNIVYRLNQNGTRDNSFSRVDISGWANILLPQTNSILLGGYMFRVNGINSGWMARVSLSGQLDTGFNTASYDYGQGIMTAIPQPGGKTLIGGSFWNTSSSYRNLARLNSNGSVDATYASTGTSSFVWSLAAQADGKTLMGGEFTTVNGVMVPALVRLTGDSDTGPGTVVFDSPTMEVFENAASVMLTVNRIWGKQGDMAVNYQTIAGAAAGGSDYDEQSGLLVFHDGETSKTMNVPILDDSAIEDIKSFQVVLSNPSGGMAIGTQSNCVVKILDDDGPASFDPNFAVQPGTFDGMVSDLAIQPDGRLVVGGWFQQVSGVSRRGVARLNQDGTVDPTFDPGSGLDYSGGSFGSGWLNQLKLQADGKLLIAGIFNKVNGTNRNYVARLNANGSLDTGFDDGSGPVAGNVIGDVRGLGVLADGRVIVGGGFTSLNGTACNGLARLNTNGTVDTTYQPASPGAGVPFGLQADGRLVYSGGDNFARCINTDGTMTRTNVDGFTNLVFVVAANNLIRQVSALSGGGTMIGGSFTAVSGQSRRCLARLLPDGSLDSSFVPDLSLFTKPATVPYVYRFAVQSDGKVLTALKTYVSPAGNYLARLNADGTLDTDFEPVRFAIPSGDNDTISAIAVQADHSIIVGGQFQTVNNLARPYLVRLKGGDQSGSRPLMVKSLNISNSQCGLALAVSPAKPFVLQTSTDMVNWNDFSTNTALTSVFNIIDDQMSGSSSRFYRVKQLVP